MNKIVVYAVVAILLGTVTMTAPLALLSVNEMGSQELAATRGSDSNSFYVPDSEQFDNASYNMMAVTPADILQVGLLIIPSFVVALGVFVYFKKRSS